MLKALVMVRRMEGDLSSWYKTWQIWNSKDHQGHLKLHFLYMPSYFSNSLGRKTDAEEVKGKEHSMHRRWTCTGAPLA